MGSGALQVGLLELLVASSPMVIVRVSAPRNCPTNGDVAAEGSPPVTLQLLLVRSDQERKKAQPVADPAADAGWANPQNFPAAMLLQLPPGTPVSCCPSHRQTIIARCEEEEMGRGALLVGLLILLAAAHNAVAGWAHPQNFPAAMLLRLPPRHLCLAAAASSLIEVLAKLESELGEVCGLHLLLGCLPCCLL